MLKKNTLRRGAILVLSLVLLISTSVKAMAVTGDPTVTVSDYGSFYTAVAEAQNGDVIGITGSISIPSIVTMNAGNRYIVIKRMGENAKLLITGDYGAENKATLKGFLFDGNSSSVGGTSPFIEVSGNAHFSMCEFVDCSFQSGNGGAVCINSGEVLFSSCRFENNCADSGAGIYNSGTLTVDTCTFSGNWAEALGGAIYNAGTLTIKNTEIKGGTANIGGGIYNGSTTELNNSLVWSNTANIHGSDIANDGTLTNNTTEAEYNSWLSYYGLFYAGWENELNTSVGGIGDYYRFLTADEDPNAEPPQEEPSEPEEPTQGGEETPPTGGNSEPTDPPITEPDSGDDEPSDKEPEDQEPPSPPSDDTQQGGYIDNSITDNSVTDNSTVDSSQSSTTTDNSQHSSTSSSNTDNSSSVSNTDNSYKRYEGDKTENSNNTSTYNYYYQITEDKGSTVATQSPSQPINISITIPEPRAPETAVQEPTEATKEVAQNIHIEAEGVNVRYNYTEYGVSISISPYKAPESPTAVELLSMANYTSNTGNTPQEPEKSLNNWLDYATVALLAILVLLELKDRLSLKKCK